MIGKYQAKLDDKSRLFVPSKLRTELGDHFYVTLGVNCGHLFNKHPELTPSDFSKYETFIKEADRYNSTYLE